VLRSWPVICAGFAIVCAFATVALSAPTPGRSVETETIVVPPDDLDRGDPGLTVPNASDTEENGTEDNGTVGPDEGIAKPLASESPPPVEYDLEKLPAPVRRLREQIIAAALTGDIEKLRPIFEANGEPPVLSFGDIDDPIDYLKSISGDPEGREILAILIEVLEAGFVHVEIGTPDDTYVWPYFARFPPDGLSGPQMVELFKLLTAGDYEDMKIYGTYLFYRVGIGPDGVWKFFVAGD
jgi:hypothetical protein